MTYWKQIWNKEHPDVHLCPFFATVRFVEVVLGDSCINYSSHVHSFDINGENCQAQPRMSSTLVPRAHIGCLHARGLLNDSFIPWKSTYKVLTDTLQWEYLAQRYQNVFITRFVKPHYLRRPCRDKRERYDIRNAADDTFTFSRHASGRRGKTQQVLRAGISWVFLQSKSRGVRGNSLLLPIQRTT